MEKYKAQTTLNEKDSLQDLLSSQKELVKLYCFAITEGCSNGFRKVVKNLFDRCVEAQFKTFLLMTEHDYYRVVSADYNMVEGVKANFIGVESELY